MRGKNQIAQGKKVCNGMYCHYWVSNTYSTTLADVDISPNLNRVPHLEKIAIDMDPSK